jgi:ketosteroid isomerase-like protein
MWTRDTRAAVSQVNIEICRRFVARLDALARRGALADPTDPDVQATLAEFLDREIEFYDPDLPGGGTFRGYAGVIEYWTQLQEAFASGDVAPERLFDAGDKVVCFLRWTARGKGSGVETDLRDAAVWTLREGKIVHWRAYLDRTEALRAAGFEDATNE